jgi:hypothetical protein
MFRALTIERFRGFEQFTAKDLRRFNLFIGKNNVGKTALLESLFLLLGPTNPDLTLTISGFRGIETFKNEPEDLWGWLFYGKDMSRPIRVNAQIGDSRMRRLTISVEDPQEMRIRRQPPLKPNLFKRSPATSSTTIGPGHLVLDYTDESGKNALTRATLKDTGISVERKSMLKFPTSVFISARAGYSADNPERYSKLEEIGEEQTVLESLSKIEPRLKKLAVLVGSSGPIIHGDIGIGRMVPLPLMGDGIGRLLTILLAIITSENGSVLIDEVENGIHYSAMEAVWSVLATTARDFNVQLFATTHSWECLKSGHRAFTEQDQDDFSVIRLDRDGTIMRSTTHDRQMVDTAITTGIEIR